MTGAWELIRSDKDRKSDHDAIAKTSYKKIHFVGIFSFRFLILSPRGFMTHFANQCEQTCSKISNVSVSFHTFPPYANIYSCLTTEVQL